MGCQGRTSIRMYGNVRVCISYITVAVIKSHFQGDLRKSLFWCPFPRGIEAIIASKAQQQTSAAGSSANTPSTVNMKYRVDCQGTHPFEPVPCV